MGSEKTLTEVCNETIEEIEKFRDACIKAFYGSQEEYERVERSRRLQRIAHQEFLENWKLNEGKPNTDI